MLHGASSGARLKGLHTSRIIPALPDTDHARIADIEDCSRLSTRQCLRVHELQHLQLELAVVATVLLLQRRLAVRAPCRHPNPHCTVVYTMPIRHCSTTTIFA